MAAGRLLHDFNVEFGDPTPPSGVLADRLAALEPDHVARRLYESLGFTNRTGGGLMYVYERDL